MAGSPAVLRLLGGEDDPMRRTTFCVLLGLLVSTSVGAAGRDPIFAGIWSSKEPGGVGALFHGLTWDQLVSHWKELGARRNQYLADVEVYEYDLGMLHSKVVVVDEAHKMSAYSADKKTLAYQLGEALSELAAGRSVLMFPAT